MEAVHRGSGARVRYVALRSSPHRASLVLGLEDRHARQEVAEEEVQVEEEVPPTYHGGEAWGGAREELGAGERGEVAEGRTEGPGGRPPGGRRGTR